MNEPARPRYFMIDQAGRFERDQCMTWREISINVLSAFGVCYALAWLGGAFNV